MQTCSLCAAGVVTGESRGRRWRSRIALPARQDISCDPGPPDAAVQDRRVGDFVNDDRRAGHGVLAVPWRLPGSREVDDDLRAGWPVDGPGAKVTYNGVEIGRVGEVEAFNVGALPRAKITLDVDRTYLKLIPQNVDAAVVATTVFGNKYIALSSPKNPSPQRINSSDVIDATHVTTAFNTLLETLVSVAQKVDPIKLNQTLTATAEAVDGLGDR